MPDSFFRRDIFCQFFLLPEKYIVCIQPHQYLDSKNCIIGHYCDKTRQANVFRPLICLSGTVCPERIVFDGGMMISLALRVFYY